MSEETTKRLLSVEETCQYLHLTRTTLYHMIEKNEIVPVYVGGRTLFDMQDLHNLIEGSKDPSKKTGGRRGRKRLKPKE